MSYPLGGGLEVSPADLRTFGAALAAGGVEIEKLDVGPELSAAGTALGGSDSAAALAGSGARMRAAFGVVGARLSGYGQTAVANALEYEVADSLPRDEGQN